jgi:hypothetical protein
VILSQYPGEYRLANTTLLTANKMDTCHFSIPCVR